MRISDWSSDVCSSYLHAAASALAAGITEELYFRLLLPLTIALVTGNALVGFAVATLLFGLAHRYQRWRGVLATSAVGAVLAFVYLASGDRKSTRLNSSH